MGKNEYIDFNHVKAHADVLTVLKLLGIEVKRQAGDEARIHCPAPDHEDRRASCDVNVKKKTFFCHSCGETGTILTLVSHFLGCDLRKACKEIAGMCDISVSPRSHPQARKKKQKARNEGEGSKPASPRPAPEEENKADFKPFTTTLRLDTEHKYGKKRGFTPEEIDLFEMGFQDRGLMQNRWCVRLHDIHGEPLGYCGRYAAKKVPKDAEKWLFPAGFPKQDVLFNAHRFFKTEALGVILVEGPFSVRRLHSLELPAVALLGRSISDEQIRILLDEFEIELVLLMMDGDAPGRKAVPGMLERLCRDFYVRDVKLPDGHDPETVPEDFIRQEVWGVV